MALIGQFRFAYSPEERRAAARGIFWHGYGKWLLAGSGLVFVAGILLCLPQPTRSIGEQVAAFGAVYAVLVVGWVYVRGARVTPFNSGEFLVEADDEAGLHVRGDVIDQTVAWSAYRRVVADQRFLYLFLSRGRAQVLPRRAGPGVEALREWLERRRLLTTS